MLRALVRKAAQRRAFSTARPRPWTHAAAVAAGSAAANDGLTLQAVGVFSGPHRARNGTPRQGCLAPHARGTVRLYEDVLAGGSGDALEGLAGFSHAILLWHVHDAAVESGLLHVSGADLLDGTPVLDIKPYIPSYDAVSDARVPNWLAAAPQTAPVAVAFSPDAEVALDDAAPSLRFCPRGAAEARAAIVDALLSELRGSYRRRPGASPRFAFYYDCLDVHVLFDDVQRQCTVTHVRLSPQWSAPAAADSALFCALLSPAGLSATASADGALLWRANGVLMGVESALPAGTPASLRYDWRAGELWVSALGQRAAHAAAALTADTGRGWRRRQATGLFLQRGPLWGGTAWLPPRTKLGLTALLEALRGRPPLSAAQYEEKASTVSPDRVLCEPDVA